jgi:hypothetical protein
VSGVEGIAQELAPLFAAESDVSFPSKGVDPHDELGVDMFGVVEGGEGADNDFGLDAFDPDRYANAISVLTCGGTISAAVMIDEGLLSSTDIWGRETAASTLDGYEASGPPGVEMSAGK